VSLSILVDMNLSPDWVPFLQQQGHSAVHWSAVGDVCALDPEIMEWARNNGRIILTHDLDFGTILAQTHASGPSVVQIRANDTFPTAIGNAVASALRQCKTELQNGTNVVVDVARSRIRLLPF
jgi:predicted nuclease of predicted toxin-antitoxin system